MRLPALCLTLALTGCAQAPKPPFSVVEATIPGLQGALASGAVTSRELVQQYLVRIATYDKKLNAVMAVNPRALQEAEVLDGERRAGRIRGPLHGIPIAIKDNIQTTDMPTTGGALAFEGFVPPYEATIVKSLRDAGAIVIAKTGMTEWANWMAGPPTPGVAAYNPVIGFGMNPYDPRRDPRAATADGRPALLPFALVANAPTPPFPDGFNARPTPFGVSFAGGACAEPQLIGIAYAFEQATRRRVPPPSLP